MEPRSKFIGSYSMMPDAAEMHAATS